ncbi:hypothetical protein R1flu_011033 [Riccia fluitans]|uniref:Small ribosomal subunit protein mS38 n=1 Tax=Riccia fluitans TaxID=41844 RepID=A0ABD1Z6N9_9MARC
MEAPGARSLALHAVRCIRRQLNFGARLDRLHRIAAPSVMTGMEDLVDLGYSNQGEVTEVRKAQAMATDDTNSHLYALIATIKNGQVGHVPTGWDALLPKEARPISFLEKIDEFMLNSSQRELRDQLALVRRSGRDLFRLVPDLAESSREGSTLSTVVADGSGETCNDDCYRLQGLQPRKGGESKWTSLLGGVEEGLRLSLLPHESSISFECSSVKRKRKKKMNKHKQRKLRRRDRHRNS